jgi:hypothetical protein
LDEFIWADYGRGIWSGAYLSDLLKIYTSKNKMRAFGFQDYRQIAVAFMEKHLKDKVDGSVWEVGENILNLQAGHSGGTTESNYAVAAGDSRVIGREAMHKYYLASKAWYQFLLKTEPIRGGKCHS